MCFLVVPEIIPSARKGPSEGPATFRTVDAAFGDRAQDPQNRWQGLSAMGRGCSPDCRKSSSVQHHQALSEQLGTTRAASLHRSLLQCRRTQSTQLIDGVQTSQGDARCCRRQQVTGHFPLDSGQRYERVLQIVGLKHFLHFSRLGKCLQNQWDLSQLSF